MSKSKVIKAHGAVNSPQDTDFWLDIWQDQQQYGFHQSGFNPLLQRFWHRLNAPINGRVLVPLCGKSLDMIWLANQGCEVIGVELSPIAVKAFFKENGLKAKKQRIGSFVRWKSGRIVIWCGDFFALSPQQLGRIDAVFDRAALTALPEDCRNLYIVQLLNLINHNTSLLLLTSEDISGEPGQTRDTVDQDLAALCQGHFTVKLLHTEVLNINHAEQNASMTAHVRVYLFTAEQEQAPAVTE